MNNYTIDSSLYTLPNMEVTKQDDKVKIYNNFIKNITLLKKLYYRDDLRLYFFKKDIFSISKNIFNKDNLAKMKESCSVSNKYIIDDLLSCFTDLLLQIISDNSDKNKKYLKHIIIDLFSDISTNKISYNNDILSEPDINNIYDDSSKSEDFRKKVLLFAFLNRFVYKDSGYNKLVVNNSIPNNKIELSAKINNINHHFLIDKIPTNNILINNQIIELIEYETINNREIIYTLFDAYNKAKSTFNETLIFNDKVEEALKEYFDDINKLGKLYPEDKRIKYHIKESPYVLYDHLDTLDKLVKYQRKSKYEKINKQQPIMERFTQNCYRHNEWACKKCCAFLRFCGYECTSEKEKGVHLKPYSKSINNGYISALSLRIYFRWDKEKIDINHIGKHL